MHEEISRARLSIGIFEDDIMQNGAISRIIETVLGDSHGINRFRFTRIGGDERFLKRKAR
jgi:hypothetical protein